MFEMLNKSNSGLNDVECGDHLQDCLHLRGLVKVGSNSVFNVNKNKISIGREATYDTCMTIDHTLIIWTSGLCGLNHILKYKEQNGFQKNGANGVDEGAGGYKNGAKRL